jgi:hypothetical protein
MGIKPLFTPADFTRELNIRLARIDKAIIQRLAHMGEECVKYARSLNTWTDQTSNLRNSIGYVIVAHGKVVKQDFDNAKTSGGGKGKETGRAYALELAKKYSSGYALIVVAGMHYAAHVESTGREVLAGAQMKAENELPGMLAELKSKISLMN